MDMDAHQMKKILPANYPPPIFFHQPQTCHHKNCTKLCETKTFGWQTSLPPVTAMGFPHAPVLCYLLLSLWATAEGGKGRAKATAVAQLERESAAPEDDGRGEGRRERCGEEGRRGRPIFWVNVCTPVVRWVSALRNRQVKIPT